MSIRPEAIKEHGDLWESLALDVNTEWVSLGCRGDNDVNYDEKDYDFTPDDLKVIEWAREELVRRGLHNRLYDQITLGALNGTVSQDDCDFYIDLFLADPQHFSPKWYDRIAGLKGLREVLNG